MSNYKIDQINRLMKELPEGDRIDVQASWLAEPTAGNDTKIVSMGDFTEEGAEHYKNFGKMMGISTGYPKLDELTKGIVPGELTVIGGKTSYGKTTLGLNIANQVALQGKPVLFVTLEMSKGEITSRYMAINGGNTETYQRVAGLTAFQEAQELNWRSIEALIARAKEELGVELVVIDHLHYLTREEKSENMVYAIGNITKTIKKNAILHKVPVLLISHVRKFTDKNSAKQGFTSEDLLGSSNIAQDADVILMINRDPDNQNLLLVRIEKNRNRGFSYENDTADLYLDKITLRNDPPPQPPSHFGAGG